MSLLHITKQNTLNLQLFTFGYLVKYISKNDVTFYRLPWHCSRDVSRLFTSETVDEPEEKERLDKILPEDPAKYSIHEEQH
jgi:hypothetical protein